jgi:predicted nicotinamide N-methyase
MSPLRDAQPGHPSAEGAAVARDEHLAGIVLGAADPASAPLVPEIRLLLARDPTGIFETVAAAPQDSPERYPPYWAFAWPGGQATARHLLDRPEIVRGRRVVDIGAGSGIAAIAAAMAGARSVLAVDVDPLAEAAIRINARHNGAAVATSTRDVLGALPAGDLILVGDLVYEPELRTRVAAMLDAAVRGGAEALVADRSNARMLRLDGASARAAKAMVAFEPVGDYDAPLIPALPGHSFERARLWRASRRPAKQPLAP